MDKVFNITEEIQQSLHDSSTDYLTNTESVSFDELIKIVKEHYDNYFKDEHVSNEKKQDRLELYHLAVIGDKETEKFLVNEIESFLRENNLINIPYPNYYDSLSHALFHEIYRFGVLQKWNNMRESPAAKFVGKEFWIEENDTFVMQEEELESEQTIREFIQRFQAGQKNLKVNDSNPYAEIALNDQTRVTIIVPPASYKPTLVFRKYVVANFSFEKQAELGTIPYEDVEFYGTLSNLYFNTVVAGHVKSGKSTFLKTIYGSRSPKKVAVLIEGTAESFLKRDFPNRLVHELYSENQDINLTIRRALRLDHDYIIVQEVRGIEAEGAIAGTERGRRGLLMSYHVTDPENTPIQLAQHIVDEYPNRRQQNEIKRVAKALDIGITMTSVEGRKKITSIYEIVDDEISGKPYVNFLIRYNEDRDKWEYNADVSKKLIYKMDKEDTELSEKFIQHLTSRAKLNPMEVDPIRYISTGKEE